MAADIRTRRICGATLQAVADAVGVSVTTVRWALAAPTTAGTTQREQDRPPAAVVDLPVLPARRPRRDPGHGAPPAATRPTPGGRRSRSGSTAAAGHRPSSSTRTPKALNVLTWRKGLAEDVDPTLSTDAAWLDETGRNHQWRVADTTVDLPIGEHDQVFTLRRSPCWSPTTRPAGNNTLRIRRGRSTY
jgi:hypothetical protein